MTYEQMLNTTQGMDFLLKNQTCKKAFLQRMVDLVQAAQKNDKEALIHAARQVYYGLECEADDLDLYRGVIKQEAA